MIAAFEIPDDWQQPRPTLTVAGHTAYVADPETASVVPVDLEAGTVGGAFTMDGVPTAIVTVGAGDGDAHDH